MSHWLDSAVHRRLKFRQLLNQASHGSVRASGGDLAGLKAADATTGAAVAESAGIGVELEPGTARSFSGRDRAAGAAAGSAA